MCYVALYSLFYVVDSKCVFFCGSWFDLCFFCEVFDSTYVLCVVVALDVCFLNTGFKEYVPKQF